MAIKNFSGSVNDAFAQLGEHVLEARTWAAVAVDLAGDGLNAPEWPYLVMRQLDRIDRSYEALSRLICETRKPPAP